MPKEPSLIESVMTGLIVGLFAAALQLAGLVLCLSLDARHHTPDLPARFWD